MSTGNWKQRAFKQFTLYAVTDVRNSKKKIIASIDKALQGGADVIQLRSKVIPDRDLFSIGREIRKLTRRRKKLFFINDRPDLVIALDADGIHLGQDDLPIPVARAIFSSCRMKVFIGKSTHSLRQAQEAEREGADYIGVGPVFSTPTKKDYKAVGLELIKQVKKHITIPFVCIGGINQRNVKDVLSAGADRIAVVRAVFSASNPYTAAKNLKKLIVDKNDTRSDTNRNTKIH